MEKKMENKGFFKIWIENHPEFNLEKQFVKINEELFTDLDVKHFHGNEDVMTHEINQIVEFEFVKSVLEYFKDNKTIMESVEWFVKELNYKIAKSKIKK